MKILAPALLVWAASRAWAACPAPPADAQVASSGGVQAAWLAEPTPVRVGQPFALRVQLCPAQARLLRVHARMPEHRHGMNYRASVKPLGQGQWRVEGMLWHMSGHWELRLDVSSQGLEHQLVQSVQLP